MEPKILTKHPQGKQGVNISKAKYEVVHDAILASLRKPLTYKELTQAVEKKLGKKFEGSITWYTVCVKLDLEARKVIERVPKTKPAQLQLRKK
jgi:hypothetical protein